MRVLSIDGVDKSGKSSIIKEVFERTNGLVYILDRSPSSWHFFNELLERSKKDTAYKKEYNAKLKDFRKFVDLSVLLHVEEEDWKSRCKEHDEQDLVGDLSFREHQREIARYFQKAQYPNVLKLNTTDLSIDECVDKIMERI